MAGLAPLAWRAASTPGLLPPLGFPASICETTKEGTGITDFQCQERLALFWERKSYRALGDAQGVARGPGRQVLGDRGADGAM